ncbi:hypothetical protein [Apibacter mensalis]|uniref:hypothetical protein n=1 Tax=Apibacter mensalis TaxID=1586267 RepID=UPI0026F34606|nr:hypothetical protein [Apibacter mensalis]
MNYLYTKTFIPRWGSTPINFDGKRYFYFSGNIRLRNEYKLSIQTEFINNHEIRKYGIVSINSNNNQSATTLGTFETACNWKIDNKTLSNVELEIFLTEFLGTFDGTNNIPLHEEKNIILKYSSISNKNLDEVNRNNKIQITDADPFNLRFKTNLVKLDLIDISQGTWFIAQGNEASDFCEIKYIDEDGWIYYSSPWLGKMNLSIGRNVEFYNPFNNYEILNNECPTLAESRSDTNSFEGYPITLNGFKFSYLINSGLLKKEKDNKYRIFISAVRKREDFGRNAIGETFIAEDKNIWGRFSLVSQKPFFEGIQYPKNRIKGVETLMWGITPIDNICHPNFLNARYIGLLNIKDGKISDAYKANYPGFILLDENGEILRNEKIREANLINVFLSQKSEWDGGWHITGLALHKSNWHLIVKNWNEDKIEREEWHIIINEKYENNIISALEGTDVNVIKKAYLLHKGTNNKVSSESIFYGQSDFNLFIHQDKLYSFYFFEPKKSGYVNSMNRMCGIAKWNDNGSYWDYQNGLQLINPVQLFRKYSHLYWCFDHWGNLCCPYFEKNKIYVATYIGTDNPDYFPAIIQLKL